MKMLRTFHRAVPRDVDAVRRRRDASPDASTRARGVTEILECGGVRARFVGVARAREKAMMTRMTTRARAEPGNEIRRNPGARRGARRKIARTVNVNERPSLGSAGADADEDGLEYAREFRDGTGDVDGAMGTTDARARADDGTSATARARDDFTHVGFVAPRVVIGLASDALARGTSTDGFGDAMDFVRGLASSNDVFGDVLRRTEREIDRLEAIGVRATTPVRDIVRGVMPEEVYEKYLAPAVAYAEASEDERGRGDDGDGGEKDDDFNDDAVNEAADAVAAAMAGMDFTVDAGAGSKDRASSTSTSSTSPTSPTSSTSMEDTVENMAAEAIMSSSAASASYVAPEATPYGADAPAVRKNGGATKTVETSSATPTTPEPAAEHAPSKPSSTKAFDATVGYWRKINDKCPDEEPLMDIMDMNIVFRQAAGLLNYLRISRPTATTWSVAANAGIIQIAEEYPIDGARAVTPRRDLRSGDQTGSVSADDARVRLETSWRDDLPGSMTETFFLDQASRELVREVTVRLDTGDAWSGTYRYRPA